MSAKDFFVPRHELPPFLRAICKRRGLYIARRDDRALGLLERLPDHGIGIVGTREPRERSVRLVHAWVERLAHQELIVLSGFARGIDAAAHDAALAHGLPTIAFLGCGLLVPYPAEHAELRERILDAGGLLITEHEPLEPAAKSNFLERNRWIAHCSRGTWVVEAARRSGALNTAKWARDASRTVWATPAFPGDAAFQGNLDLLELHSAIPLWGPGCFAQEWIGCATLVRPEPPSQDPEFFETKDWSVQRARAERVFGRNPPDQLAWEKLLYGDSTSSAPTIPA
jgi:DNA protecting protein DprA